MKSILTNNYAIHFNSACYKRLNSFIADSNFSKIFVLVDSNTHKYCLPYFLSNITASANFEIIEIESGEIHKTIDTCVGVWNALSELDADRKSLIINVGGGVVTDLGGFVASTFRRGIKYINVPTTLLAMVDASVGGKTGVDLGTLKNQIGVVNFSEMVLVDSHFLDSLPQNEMRSGLAEMLKHGLIHSETYWNDLNNLDTLTLDDLEKLIHESIVIKNNIVSIDPNENGLRKTLNYGHTLGHAIESFCLENESKTTLLHGEAIVIGMILATYLSYELVGFPENKLHDIKNALVKLYGKTNFNTDEITAIIELMKFDKKNSHGNINFVLLEDIGKAKIDQIVSNELIHKAFNYYQA